MQLTHDALVHVGRYCTYCEWQFAYRLLWQTVADPPYRSTQTYRLHLPMHSRAARWTLIPKYYSLSVGSVEVRRVLACAMYIQDNS